MITLKQLFQVFGHDAKWARFATASAVPMTTVFLRKLGDRDTITLAYHKIIADAQRVTREYAAEA